MFALAAPGLPAAADMNTSTGNYVYQHTDIRVGTTTRSSSRGPTIA